MKIFIKIMPYLALGITSILRVMWSRVGVKLGINPVRCLRAVISEGSVFSGVNILKNRVPLPLADMPRSIHYFANGSNTFPKERVEVFVDGRVLQLDNFRKLKGFGWPGFSKLNLWKQDKGQVACAKAFIDSIASGSPCPISPDEIFEVARVTLEASEQLRAQ